ncbi:uncharacterized protein LOC133190690 [Saccostrea echinata]|uniref:uncharacterized protein LOC133190690 n=1 Tax=Saccostrea echinata TaxID=191078 RepID=UPI002A81277E|nr:uncharacterized protein LOC133190690 [Saccostrea echinata]
MEEDQENMLKKLEQMKKEYARKQRKLEKSVRKSKAKAHVKQILQKQEILRSKETEQEDFKNQMKEPDRITTPNDQDNTSKTKNNPRTDIESPKVIASDKNLALKTPVLSENSDKGDFMICDSKTLKRSEEDDIIVGPRGDSEQSASSRNFPSSSESTGNGKKTLSLKARRRKTLSPNTFSSNRSKVQVEEIPCSEGIIKSIHIPDDEDVVENNDTRDKHMNSLEIKQLSNETKLTEKLKPSESESSIDLFPSSFEGCEKIKTRRKRGRPAKCRRASLPAQTKTSLLPANARNSSESQDSQELETLMLVQESLGLCSPIEKRKTRRSRSCQPILLSSVFQFIIDDAKRDQEEKDFVLPTHTFGDLMETKDLHKFNDGAESYVDDQENKMIKIINQDKEISMKEEMLDDTEQTPSSVFLDSKQTVFEHCEKPQKGEFMSHPVEQQGVKVLSESTSLGKRFEESKSSPKSRKSLVKGHHSNLNGIAELVSKDSEKENALKESHMNLEIHAELSVKENDGSTETDSSKIYDEPICSEPQGSEKTAASQEGKENGQTEEDLNSSLGSDQQTESDDENFGDILREKMAIQFPTDDPVMQTHITVFPLNKKKTEVIVCLCKKSISVWALQCEQFTCLQKWSFPEDQTAIGGDLMLPRSSEIRFAAILGSSNKTQLYSAVFQEDQAFPLFEITDIPTPSHLIHVCAVKFNEVVISQSDSPNTIKLSKYVMDSDVKNLSETRNLEETSGVLDNVCGIQGQQQAVAGYTKDGLLHVWNHELGALVLTVNLAVYWPHPSHLVAVLQEKGYLFCPLMANSDCFLAGCIMLVNPTNCQTKVLFPLNSKKWKGCSRAFYMDDYIAAVNKSGSLHIWDKFSGEMVSCMENTDVLGMCNHKSNIFLSREHCIHCFTLKC